MRETGHGCLYGTIVHGDTGIATPTVSTACTDPREAAPAAATSRTKPLIVVRDQLALLTVPQQDPRQDPRPGTAMNRAVPQPATPLLHQHTLFCWVGWAVTLPVLCVRSRHRDQSTWNQSNRRPKSYDPNKRYVPIRPAALSLGARPIPCNQTKPTMPPALSTAFKLIVYISLVIELVSSN